MVAKWSQNGRKMDGKQGKFAVILHRIFKIKTMKPLSVIAIGTAYANYRKAKRTYQALKEADQATIDALNLRDAYLRLPKLESEYEAAQANKRYEQLISELEADERDVTGKLASVEVTPVVRIGSLNGKYCHASISLVFKNLSDDKSYRIHDVKADANVFGSFLRGSVAESSIDFNLDPLTCREIALAKTTCELDELVKEQLKADICEALGKKLFSSCVGLKVSIAGAASADIQFKYGSAQSYAGNAPATYPHEIGVLRYVGEAY